MLSKAASYPGPNQPLSPIPTLSLSHFLLQTILPVSLDIVWYHKKTGLMVSKFQMLLLCKERRNLIYCKKMRPQKKEKEAKYKSSFQVNSDPDSVILFSLLLPPVQRVSVFLNLLIFWPHIPFFCFSSPSNILVINSSIKVPLFEITILVSVFPHWTLNL